MLRIKKLDIFIIKSFVMLFIGTFFICLFIFMMQFLWRYVDELVGKGLEIKVLAEFFFYSALTLVPGSFPLAILLASLITFGNFGERYELLAMKAAGISLIKIMRPLIVFVVFLCCVSFFFQNVVAPKAQVKLWTLLISMKQKSPELDIPEGVFYDEIEGYNLYVKGKNRDTGILYQVMIYNFSDGFENAHIIVADSGRLEMTADKQHLYLHLYNGEQFENLKSQNSSVENVPYRRESFREKHSIIEFDAGFNMVDGGFMSDQSISKNMWTLQESIDSMTLTIDSIGRTYYKEAKEGPYRNDYLSSTDSIKLQKEKIKSVNMDSLFNVSTLVQKQKLVTGALGQAETIFNDLGFKSFTTADGDKSIRKHMIEWHRKITISLACLIFFFIGAPLGAIIRKGGLGMPVVVSVFIFIVYYIIDNTGYKMARDAKWEVWMGMWMSTLVLAPLGGFLSYKSNKDSVVLNADAYVNWFKMIVGIRSTRHLTKKEVIIEDPKYNRISTDIDLLCAKCETYMQEHRLTTAPNYLHIWTKREQDEEIKELSTQLESLVEELSNSTSATVLNVLNRVPILATGAHQSPFKHPTINIAVGIFFPLGLVFHFRIWIFRVRLNNDLKQIIKICRELQTAIKQQ
ncbi:MAG: LptF/LptG family permease [Bacteroides sp.]